MCVCVCVCVCVILTLELCNSWTVGRSAPIILSVLTVWCRVFKADLVSRQKQTVMEVNGTDSLMTVSAGSTRQLGKDTESGFI